MVKDKINRFPDWSFEEETREPIKNKVSVEISFIQVIVFIIITIIFLFWVFYSHSRSFSTLRSFNVEKYIESKIEKDYFKDNNTLKNGDFSRGLRHWVTSDGGKTFPESKSGVSLEKEDFHSPPYSMKIESIYPANRFHYSKSPRPNVIDNAYGFIETKHWLGVLPGSDVRASMWYKGDMVSTSIICLKKREDSWVKIAYAEGAAADEWKKIEVKGKVPKRGRAIAIEITVNKEEGKPLPVVLIDDVEIKIEGN